MGGGRPAAWLSGPVVRPDREKGDPMPEQSTHFNAMAAFSETGTEWTRMRMRTLDNQIPTRILAKTKGVACLSTPYKIFQLPSGCKQLFNSIVLGCRPPSRSSVNVYPMVSHRILRAVNFFSSFIVPEFLLSGIGPGGRRSNRLSVDLLIDRLAHLVEVFLGQRNIRFERRSQQLRLRRRAGEAGDDQSNSLIGPGIARLHDCPPQPDSPGRPASIIRSNPAPRRLRW